MAKKLSNTSSSQMEHTYQTAVILGISIGALVLLSGFVLCVLGLSGSIDWVVEGTGLKSRLTNGTPGVFFALVGLAVMWKYKPKIKHSQTDKTEKTVLKSGGSDGTFSQTTVIKTESSTQGARLATRK